MTMSSEVVTYLDSHVHFWKLDRGDYHWLKPTNPTLYQNYLPSNYFATDAAQSIRSVIAVQAAPTVEETEYLLELAKNDERIAGVVGWLDPFSESFADEYSLLRNNPRFVGIRLDRSVFDKVTEQPSELLLEHLRLLENDRFTVDLLINPGDMPAVLRCLKAVPRLKAVINHLGGPPIRDGQLEPWSAYMSELARFPNTYCKWSGMITSAGGMKPDLLTPYIRHTAERFGPNRMMFGSDWPVALQAGKLEDVLQWFQQLLPEYWTKAEHAKVRHSNAAKCYLE